MKNMVIIAKHSCVANNIKDFLVIYFREKIHLKEDISCLKEINLTPEDVVIIVSETHPLNEDLINNIKSIVIVLSPFNSGFNKGKIINLTFPIFLPYLLHNIQQLCSKSLNISQNLSIPGYNLSIDYGDVTLKSLNLRKCIKFTFSEGKLLKSLFEYYPKEVLKEDILPLVNYPTGSNILETHILNIKSKLQQNNFSITIVKEKQGYKLLLQ